ncbi:MAG: thiamine pyrophosphate-dependent enzyme [Paracoccus sp. (in: a-proteobacteria)]
MKRSTKVDDALWPGRGLRHPRRAGGRHGRPGHRAAEKAVARYRAGKTYILEVMTYRYRSHLDVRPREIPHPRRGAKMRDERDPIEHVRELLLQGKHASEDDLKAIDKEIKEEIVNDSAEFSKKPRAAAGRAVDRYLRQADA